MANITNSNKIIDLLNGIKQRLQQIEDSIPENVSELTNDAGYITNAVSDLVNYYDKGEVDDLLAGIVGLEIVKVDELPDEGENGKIYLLSNSGEGDNVYDEYIRVSSDSKFEKIGTLEADFSDYYNKEEVDDKLDGKIDNPDSSVETGHVLIKTDDGQEWGEYFSRMKLFEMSDWDDLETATEIYKYITENQNYNVGFTVGFGQGVEGTTSIYKPVFRKLPTDNTLYFLAERTMPNEASIGQYNATFNISNGKVTSISGIKGLMFQVRNNPPSNPSEDRVYICTASKEIWLGGNLIANFSDLTDYYTKTQLDTLLDAKVDDADLDNYYTKTEVDTALDLKANKDELPTVNDASVTVKQGTTNKGTFTLNQAGDVTIELDEGGDGDVKYADFEFSMIAQSPDGKAIIGQMLSGILNVNRDLTLLPHDELKAGMQYLVRVNNTDSTDHDVTFDGVTYTIKAGETKNLVFLAVDGSTLELQECTGGGGSGPSLTVGDGNITVQNQYGEELGSFSVNQTEDAVITINESSASGDMKYQDFTFSAKSGATIELGLNSSITPTADFTVNSPSTIKNGQVYILRVTNEGTPVTMTLGNGITNPFNVDLTLTEDGVDQFVFLATEGVLELQPQLLTKADVEQILRDHGLIP